MYADSLLGILNSKEAAGYLRIIALLIIAVALSSCATSTHYYENRVTEDVLCPVGMSAYHLAGVLPSTPNARRDMVCMPDERMRQMAGQQAKNLESTVSAQPSGEPPA